MNINKRLLNKYELFKRLEKRWQRLPRNVIAQVCYNYEVNEEVLNRVAIDNFNNRFKKRNDKQRNT